MPGDTLRFVQGQNLCIPCRFTLALAFSHENKAKLFAQVAVGPFPRRDEFNQARESWERTHNETTSGYVRYKEWRLVHDERLESKQIDAFEVEEMHGYLWPTQIWESHFKVKVGAGQRMATVRHKGQSITGVIERPDAGWAFGVLKLTSLSKVEVERTTELGRRSDEIVEGQLDQKYKTQLGHMKFDMNVDENNMPQVKRWLLGQSYRSWIPTTKTACFKTASRRESLVLPPVPAVVLRRNKANSQLPHRRAL